MTPADVNAAIGTASTALQTMLPLFEQQHVLAQQEIGHALAAVQACHDEHGGEVSARLEQAVTRAGVAKDDCDEGLDNAVEAEHEACAGQGENPNCLCDEARTAITDQTALCVAVTETYEAVYCELQVSCTSCQQCHAEEIEVYGALRADIEAAMTSRQEEYRTFIQVDCLMNLITTAMLSGSPIDHASLVACDDVSVNHLAINFPVPPSAPTGCPAPQSGDPRCPGSPVQDLQTSDFTYSSAHAGKYLAGHAGGDSTIRPMQSAAARCDELGYACAGITCRSETTCTVRAGNDLRQSPSGEFSFVKGSPVAPVAHAQAQAQAQAEWTLIAHHVLAGGLFASATKNTFVENAEDPAASTYMIAGQVTPSDYLVDGKYRLRLEYSDLQDAHQPCNDGPALSGSVTLEWLQSSWVTAETVTGFEAISPSDLSTSAGGLGCQFAGLARSSHAGAVLDGSHQHDYWFGTVGAVSTWSGGIPAWKGGVAQSMSLYVRR